MRKSNRRGVCNTADHFLSRRLFLQGAMAGTAALGGFGRLFSAEAANEAKREQKHVILLWMSGGASQFETWDPKPGRPTAGPHMTIPTSIPGVHFDEFMPGLARLADKMAVIRSLQSSTPGHVEGSLELQTGYLPSPATADHPHFMSVLSHEIPAVDAGVPNFVKLGEGNKVFPDPGPGFLGAKYGALVCQMDGKGPSDLPAPNSAMMETVERREALRARLSEWFRTGRNTALVDTHDAAYARVSDLLTGHEIFDISKESTKDHERYGDTRFGRDCLLARRLVEHGVPFVKVQDGTSGIWDKHDMLANGQRHLTAKFDQAASALIDDLIDRGLYEKTLVICLGEMGRTPNINGNGGGRDHWNKCWSMSLGGCGIRGGVVVGSTDENGTDIKDRLVTVHELFATFYTALGVDPHSELEFETRPIPLVEEPSAKPLPELL